MDAAGSILTQGEGFLETFPVNMSQDVMWLPVEVSQGQLTEELVAGKTNDTTNYRCLSHPMQTGNSSSLRLFRACHDMGLILAVVELCSSAQPLILLPSSELLKLLQVARKLVAV